MLAHSTRATKTPFRLAFCVSKYPHISTLNSGMSSKQASRNFSGKNFPCCRKESCGIKTCSDADNVKMWVGEMSHKWGRIHMNQM